MSRSFGSAWVIGASSGIGRDLALILAREGTSVFASARRQAALDSLARETADGVIHPLPLDIADPVAIADAAANIKNRWSVPDLVVVAAGIFAPATADELDPKRFTELMTVNYLGVVNVLAAVLPFMMARGSGHIAVVASVSGYRGLPLASAYGPTKAAVISLCESLVHDLKARGVRLQLVNPGFVDTPMTEQNTFPMPFMISSADAAKRLRRGLDSGRFEITFPKRFTWLLKFLRLLPYVLYMPLIRLVTGRGGKCG
jgi:short-subunit dehydrogenase